MAADHSDGDDTRNAAQAAAPASPGNPGSQKEPRSDARSRSASLSEDGETASDSNAPAGAASPTNPPLPDEEAPPLPDEVPPEDDGWDAMWDTAAGAYYFYNRFTHATQWENPRVPQATAATYGSYDRYTQHIGAPGTTSSSAAPGTSSPPRRRAGGYNPAIHGSYDPNADYAKEAEKLEEEEQTAAPVGAPGLSDPNQLYAATGQFNRFTGRFQNDEINPENHNDENKSRRQMSAFFDVDAAANSHDGRSLKAERRGKNLTKKELKAYKDKRREKKEEKRRAWLRD